MRANRIAVNIFKTIAFGVVLIWSLLPIAVIIVSSSSPIATSLPFRQSCSSFPLSPTTSRFG